MLGGQIGKVSGQVELIAFQFVSRINVFYVNSAVQAVRYSLYGLNAKMTTLTFGYMYMNLFASVAPRFDEV